jgi:flagellar basal body-associated protein FliL
MKKGLIILLLLIPFVFAQGIETSIQTELSSFEAQQRAEVYNMKESLASMERSQTSQTLELEKLSNKIDYLMPDIEKPAKLSAPNYLLVLLFVNIALLIAAIILIFYLRSRYKAHIKHEEFEKENIHPVPDDLILYVKAALMLKKPLHDVRLDLAAKGWTPSMIEHAISAARR